MIATMLWLAASLAVYEDAPPVRVAAADERRATIKPFSGSRYCAYDRIMVGPGQSGFVAWANDSFSITGLRAMLPPSEILFGRLALAPGDSDKLFTFGGQGLRLFPIRWSKQGDRLYVRVREPRGRIATITPDGQLLPGEFELAPSWKYVDIQASSYGDIEALRSPSVVTRVSRIDNATYLRGAATLDEAVSIVAVRPSDRALIRLSEGADKPSGLSSSMTRFVQILPDDRDFKGGVSFLGAERRNSTRPYIPYQRPILDQSTGRVIGVFGLDRMAMDAGALQQVAEQLQAILRRDGGVILDASSNGQSLVALARFGEGRKSLFTVDRAGVREKTLCFAPVRQNVGAGSAAKASDPGDMRLEIFSLDGAGRRTSAPGNVVAVHYYDKRSAGTDAVIYFHGGPTDTLVQDVLQLQELRLLNPNREIIAIEYSGSVGGGEQLTRRLMIGGMRSLNEDLDALANWLRKRQYRHVDVVGSSFGSVPGMIASVRHPELFRQAFHVAPLLELQNPSAWASRSSGLDRVNAQTQLQFERHIFGGESGREAFQRDLRSLVARASKSQTSTFYFGALDSLSKPSHLPPSSTARTVVIPRAGHAVVGATTELWADIAERINH
ncbi:MAG TPA: alpha/beta hydrolase [Woeseiaceae bacterium]